MDRHVGLVVPTLGLQVLSRWPAGREHLAFYARNFSTVEVNNSYYRLPARTTFESWRMAAPDGFLFAVKASRYLTHMKLLKEPEEPLARLLGNAAGLADKLGPACFSSRAAGR